jgi:phage shock protein PspC (stress-responsive transcriptional regulator)
MGAWDMFDSDRKLYRSRTDRVLGGVCGGLAEFLDVDPILIRVAWVAMALLKGFGIILYLLWIFVVPLKPFIEEKVKKERRSGGFGIVFGSALILIGFLFLADEWRWIDLDVFAHWSLVGPVILMLVGVWFLLRSSEKRKNDASSEDSGSSSSDGTSTEASKRFVRDRQDKKIFGVCGGIGKYIGLDPTVVRILFIGFTLATPPVGLVTYFALALLTPSQPHQFEQPVGSQPS